KSHSNPAITPATTKQQPQAPPSVALQSPWAGTLMQRHGRLILTATQRVEFGVAPGLGFGAEDWSGATATAGPEATCSRPATVKTRRRSRCSLPCLTVRCLRANGG